MDISLFFSDPAVQDKDPSSALFCQIYTWRLCQTVGSDNNMHTLLPCICWNRCMDRYGTMTLLSATRQHSTTARHAPSAFNQPRTILVVHGGQPRLIYVTELSNAFPCQCIPVRLISSLGQLIWTLHLVTAPPPAVCDQLSCWDRLSTTMDNRLSCANFPFTCLHTAKIKSRLRTKSLFQFCSPNATTILRHTSFDFKYNYKYNYNN